MGKWLVSLFSGFSLSRWESGLFSCVLVFWCVVMGLLAYEDTGEGPGWGVLGSDVEEHEGLVSLRQEGFVSIVSCDEVLKNQMVFQRAADSSEHFNTIIRAIQAQRSECSEDIWNPVAVDAADQFAGDLDCFWHDVGMGGPLVGESEVPSGLRADGLPDGDLPLVSGRDLENNIIVFWSSTWAERPGDGAVCWMYVAVIRVWDASY